MNKNKRIKELEEELERLRAEASKVNEEPTTRVCSKCGVEKPLEDFHKDKTKTLNRGYVCKKCVSKYQKSRNKGSRPENIRRESKDPDKVAMMTDDAFKLYYYKQNIRDAIRTESIRYAKNRPEFQQDLIQIAWGRIAMCESGHSDEYYIEVAEKAIFNEYWKVWARNRYDLEYVETMGTDEYLMWSKGVWPY